MYIGLERYLSLRKELGDQARVIGENLLRQVTTQGEHWVIAEEGTTLGGAQPVVLERYALKVDGGSYRVDTGARYAGIEACCRACCSS